VLLVVGLPVIVNYVAAYFNNDDPLSLIVLGVAVVLLTATTVALLARPKTRPAGWAILAGLIASTLVYVMFLFALSSQMA
jgi:hypothetical protein